MILLFLLFVGAGAYPSQQTSEIDGTASRKVLGSSVVTSVSVVMDGGSGTKFADAVGKPVNKPSSPAQVASPINLLNPDRYEFYTFDDSGDLVKRLMTLEEIQSIIANGDGEAFNYNSQSYTPEKKVNDVVSNVQNVIKEEIKQSKNHTISSPVLDTPDVSSTWSMILPAIFGNSGEQIKPERPQISITPDTIMVENPTVTPSPVVQKPMPFTPPKQEVTEMTNKPTGTPLITVAIITHTKPNDKKGTTEDVYVSITPPTRKPTTTKKPIELKPENKINSSKPPISKPPIRPSTYRPATYKQPVVLSTTNRVTFTTRPSSTTKPTTTTTTKSVSYVTRARTTTTTARPTTRKYVTPTTTATTTTTSTTRKPTTTTTTTTTTTQPPTTSLKYETSQPLTQFIQLFDIPTTQKATAEPLKQETKPIYTTTPLGLGTTVFIIDHKTNTKIPITTKEQLTSLLNSLPLESTTELLKFSPSSTIVQAITPQEFSTLRVKPIPSSTTTTEAPQKVTTAAPQETTTLLPSTEKAEQTNAPEQSDLDKLSVPEILDQLLLTSTNIYEINTELTNKIPQNDVVGSTTEKPDAKESTTEIDVSEVTTVQSGNTETTQQPSSASTDSDNDELPGTTEPNIINSIEQLIQQAVGNIAGMIGDKSQVDKVTVMAEKPMSQVQMESATSASSLFDRTSNTEQTDQTIMTTDDIFSQAMDSLLSQVVGSEQQGLTTLNQLPSTTELLNTETDAEVRQEPVDVTEEILKVLEDSLGVNSENTDRIFDNESATRTESAKLTETTTEFPTSTNSPTEAQNTEDSNEILNTEASSYLENELNESTTLKGDLETTTTLLSTNAEYTTAAQEVATEKAQRETTTENVKPQQPKETTIIIITKPQKGETQSPQVANKIAALKPEVKKEDLNWSLVSTIAPHKNYTSTMPNSSTQKTVTLTHEAHAGQGLEDSTSDLDPDIKQFVALCNELAFGFWNSVNNGISAARSAFVSPFAATSLLAMVFLGARGATSGEMNEILKLDDMVTFNPHLIFRNVTESIMVDKASGIASSVILRELYSDRSKGHLLSFYKERAKQFYDGHVEEVSFKEVGDVIRRRTNLIVKRQTWGKVSEFIKDSSIVVKPPLAGVSVSIFQTDCSSASKEGRDGELYFVVLPSIRQRRLIPVPAVVYRSGYLAGYEPGIDATAVSIGNPDNIVSTIFVIPGQQGIAAPGDDLARLERQLVNSAFKDGAWSRLLKSLIPRPGLELQIPRFSHRSIINASVALKHMGMRDLFDSTKADLRGLNGVANDLFLSDILQVNNFATCGEDAIGSTHHSEIYPATANRTYRGSRKFKDVLQPEDAYYDSELLEEPRDYQRAFHDPLHDPTLFSLPLPLRPRQARLPDPPRLRFDRPFLYFVRHNPTGLILHMGRFNPRLLP